MSRPRFVEAEAMNKCAGTLRTVLRAVGHGADARPIYVAACDFNICGEVIGGDALAHGGDAGDARGDDAGKGKAD